jgi:hypothetical protein
LFEAAGLNLRFERARRFDGIGRGLIGVQSGLHGCSPVRMILSGIAKPCVATIGGIAGQSTKH